MTDHELLAAIKEICSECFDSTKQVSDLHRAQALAIIWCALLTDGANLPQPQEKQETDQITFDDILEDVR